jgi:hypothetical protein
MTQQSFAGRLRAAVGESETETLSACSGSVSSAVLRRWVLIEPSAISARAAENLESGEMRRGYTRRGSGDRSLLDEPGPILLAVLCQLQ